MDLPFTVDEFLQVFARYNEAIWPFQILLTLLAIATIGAIMWRSVLAQRMVTGWLAFLWMWMGWVYHITFFSVINPVALAFGVLFLIQGSCFAWWTWKGGISYSVARNGRGLLGGLLALYGLVIYPLLGWWFGHRYPSMPTFGAPCPTTIVTFAILLWSSGFPRPILFIPLIWSVIGFTAALKLGIYQDVGLLAAGVIAAAVMLKKPTAVVGHR